MARRNCIVTDGGSCFDRDDKTIYTNDGNLIANLYNLDIDRMSDDDLAILAIAFELAYRQGYNTAQRKLTTKIQEIFGI